MCTLMVRDMAKLMNMMMGRGKRRCINGEDEHDDGK